MGPWSNAIGVGDTLFAVGAIALVVFVIGLRAGYDRLARREGRRAHKGAVG